MDAMTSDLWLAEFEDAAEAPGVAGGAAVGPGWLGSLCRVWAAEGPAPWRRYACAEASPGPAWQRLSPLISLPGASAAAVPGCHYVVETDVEPGHEADFDAWYTQEHLPGLAAVPGTVHAARYVRQGSPRFLALYLLTDPQVLGSPPWLAVRGTPWSDRVRPRFRNTRRLMFHAA